MAEEKISPEPTLEPQPVVEPVSEPEIPPKQVSNRLKIILLSVLGLVLVGGPTFAGYKLGQKQAKPGPTPTPITVATPTPDPTANWKTYTNTSFGFSIKYPGDYFKYQDTSLPTEDGIFLATSAPQGGNSPKFLGLTDLWLNIGVIPNENSLDQYIASQNMLPNAQKTPITIEGISGYEITYQLQGMSDSSTGPYTYEGLLLKNSNLYTISLSSWNQATLIKTKPMFDQILSTFKFLPEGSGQGEKVFCEDPRPEVCTMECIANPPYICGSNGKLYCNKCAACADWKVDWYVVQDEPCGI